MSEVMEIVTPFIPIIMIIGIIYSRLSTGLWFWQWMCIHIIDKESEK